VAGTRGRVLSAIRAAPGPVGVHTLAAELDLHPNTVRFHLGALIRDGLVAERPQPSGGRGRPRTVYRATSAGTRSGERNYRLLSAVLIGGLAGSEAPRTDAYAAGRLWGRQLGLDDSRDTSADVLTTTVEVLDDMGVEPSPGDGPQPHEIHLHNCPFRELVDTHQELVCAVHAGMLEGLVSELREDGDRPDAPSGTTLLPFVTPAECLVRLEAVRAS